MQRALCSIVLGVALAIATGLAGGGQETSQVQTLPYTVHFKTTTVKSLVDGTTSTSESSEVWAVDSKGRFLTSYTHESPDQSGQRRTDLQVRDRINLTSTYWSDPGTTATVVHMPDLGDINDECAKKMKAIDSLHPVSAESSRGQALPIKDLGTRTIHGIEARGGEVTFTPTIMRLGSGPMTRTNEVWLATDPRLDKLMVLSISRTSQGETTTRELVDFSQAEPDPMLFQTPPGRIVTKREGRAYVCDIHPQPRAVAPAPNK